MTPPRSRPNASKDAANNALPVILPALRTETAEPMVVSVLPGAAMRLVVDTTALPPGMYVLRVISDRGDVRTSRFTVVR